MALDRPLSTGRVILVACKTRGVCFARITGKLGHSTQIIKGAEERGLFAALW